MTFRLSRVAVLLALVLILTAVGSAVATYLVAKDEFRAVLDHDLKKQSKFLIALIEEGQLSLADPDFGRLMGKIFRPGDEEAIWVNVYDMRTGMHVSNFENDYQPERLEIGEVSLRLDGTDWHGFQRVEDELVVQLLRSNEHLARVEGEILEEIQVPLLAAGGVNLLILLAVIGLTLWPLTRLSRQLENRSPELLDPLDVRSPATEVRVFRDTLNRLMRDVNDALARERQFANDAAHELRTPLTTLKLELSSDEPNIGVLKSETDRLADLIEQLLTLARVDQGHWQRDFVPVALGELCRRELERLGPEFEQHAIHLIDRIAPANVQGDELLLVVLVKNLAGNVLRHCNPGTDLAVEVESAPGGGAIMRFVDSGPGIDTLRLESLNEGAARFDSRGEGLGLGLAICRKIADLHGASLHFGSNPGGNSGLVVSVTFVT